MKKDTGFLNIPENRELNLCQKLNLFYGEQYLEIKSLWTNRETYEQKDTQYTESVSAVGLPYNTVI